jgi:hypothetical protein
LPKGMASFSFSIFNNRYNSQFANFTKN